MLMLASRRGVLRMSIMRRVGASLQRHLSTQAPAESTVPLQLYLDLMQEKERERMQLLKEKDAKIDEKDAEIEEKERERMQLLKEKDAKIEEKDANIEEKDAKIEEKDAKIEEKVAKIEEKDAKIEQLLLSKQKLELYKMRALIDAGRVELRSILEHVLRIEGFGTHETGIKKLFREHSTVVHACKREHKIQSDLRCPVTVNALAAQLHKIWMNMCSDVHPQLSPADWRLRYPDESIMLRTTKLRQSDALLLYHLFQHFDYPVEIEDVVPHVP